MSFGAIRVLTLGAALCVLAPVREARAGQAPQTPVQPPTDPGPTAPPTVTTQSGDDRLPKVAAGAPPWVYSVALQEAFDSNVQDVQLTSGAGTGDWHTGLEGSLSRGWAFPRGSLALMGSGDQLLYRSAKDLNRFTYGLGAGGSYAMTSRLMWRGTESLTSMYAPDSEFLTTAGLVLPRVVTRINIASTGLSYQFTRKVQGNVSLTTSKVMFPGGELINGTGIAIQTSISRQLTKNQTAGLSFGHTFSSGGDIQGLLGTWQHTHGRTSLNAAFGVRPYSLHGVSKRQYAPGGLIGVSFKVSNTESVTASYERAVEQAFGFTGTHLAHRLNSGYLVSVGRRLGLEGNASYGLNTYPQIADFWLSGQAVAISGRYLLGRRTSLGASYGLWIRRATNSPTTSTYRTTFYLSYGGTWR